jgi:hypothetical protein
MSRKSELELRRYTDLGSALDMVLNERLVLLNPQSWDDRNDSHFLETYRARRSLGAVRVACLSMREETYHHWKIFGPSATGVCLVFHRQPLIDFVTAHKRLRGGIVSYKTISELQRLRLIQDDELPFVKRFGYGDEGEYRILFESKKPCEDAHPIKLPLNLIERIVMSPWTPRPVYWSIKKIFRKIGLPNEIDVTRSTLTNTEMWKEGLAELLDLADGVTPCA